MHLNLSNKEEEKNISSADLGSIKKYKQYIKKQYYKLLNWIFQTFFIMKQKKLTALEMMMVEKHKVAVNLEFEIENQDESIFEDIKIYLKDSEVIIPMGSSRKLIFKCLYALF